MQAIIASPTSPRSAALRQQKASPSRAATQPAARRQREAADHADPPDGRVVPRSAVIRRKVGLDAVIGMVPVLGDLVSAGIGLYLVFEARELGASRWLQAEDGWQPAARTSWSASFPCSATSSTSCSRPSAQPQAAAEGTRRAVHRRRPLTPRGAPQPLPRIRRARPFEIAQGGHRGFALNWPFSRRVHGHAYDPPSPPRARTRRRFSQARRSQVGRRARPAPRGGTTARPVAAGDVAPARTTGAVDRFAVSQAVAAANRARDRRDQRHPEGRGAGRPRGADAVADAAEQGGGDAGETGRPGHRTGRRLAQGRLSLQKPAVAPLLREAEVRCRSNCSSFQAWVKETGQKVVILFEGATPPARAHHPALHGAPEPARLAGGGAGEAQRVRARPVVLPALRAAPAHARRDRDVRPLLVQTAPASSG